MTNSILHKADTRGTVNHGWLQAKHSFSFGSYYNPERMHFGVLRVFNDDIIAGGKGFGLHPHDNMEIISIPLAGDLQHKDNMGNTTIIRHGDVQVMSAGTGVMHSEVNANMDEAVNLLQIWLYPNQKNVMPRYQQITLDVSERKNKLQQILSPNIDDAGVWIHQNAWFHMGNFDAHQTFEYTLKNKKNGLYIFVIEGAVTANGQALQRRDGYGLEGIEHIPFTATSDVQILLLEVPMEMI